MGSHGRREDGWEVCEEKEHLWKSVSGFLFSISLARIHFAVVHQRANGDVYSKGIIVIQPE